MSKRRSIWDIIPLGSVIGTMALIGMSMFAPLQPFLIYVALLVIAYTMFKFLVQIGDAEERIKAMKMPEKQVKVQPEGPSFQEVLRAIPDPVMIVSGYEPNDIAGRWIVFANTAAMKMFQMEREGGILVSTIRNPEVLECVDEALFGESLPPPILRQAAALVSNTGMPFQALYLSQALKRSNKRCYGWRFW